MKKILKSIIIIFALSLISFVSSAQVTATVVGSYFIKDIAPPPNSTYVARLEIVTKGNTDTWSSIFTPVINQITPFSFQVSGVAYPTPPPNNADYYMIILHVVRLVGGVFNEEKTGKSYAAMSYFGGIYTLTANYEIDVNM